MKKLTKLLVMALLTACTLFVVACTPKNVGDAVEKLVNDNYNVEVVTKGSEYIGNIGVENFDLDCNFTVISGEKETTIAERRIIVIIFEKTSDAKKIMDDFDAEFEDISEEYEIIIERDGNVIIIADEKAYKDFTE